MKFSAALIVLLTSTCFGQASSIQARLEKLVVSQCRKDNTNFELQLATRFKIANNSNKSVLVAKKIEVTPSIYMAPSKKDAQENKFPIKISEEYAFDQKELKAPTLEDFQILKASESLSREFALITLTGSKSARTKTLQIKPGRYWVKLGFSTLPFYLAGNRKEAEVYRDQWESIGHIENSLVWTEPFLVLVRFNSKAPLCSHN